jgi:hypothetical protein
MKLITKKIPVTTIEEKTVGIELNVRGTSLQYDEYRCMCHHNRYRDCLRECSCYNNKIQQSTIKITIETYSEKLNATLVCTELNMMVIAKLIAEQKPLKLVLVEESL